MPGKCTEAGVLPLVGRDPCHTRALALVKTNAHVRMHNSLRCTVLMRLCVRWEQEREGNWEDALELLIATHHECLGSVFDLCMC